jgi:hypothetical protein
MIRSRCSNWIGFTPSLAGARFDLPEFALAARGENRVEHQRKPTLDLVLQRHQLAKPPGFQRPGMGEQDNLVGVPYSRIGMQPTELCPLIMVAVAFPPLWRA